MRFLRSLQAWLVLALLIASPVQAVERLSNGYTQHQEAFFRAGFWWDSTDPGWGIDLHMSGDVMIGAWATYDTEGKPTWYLGVGTLQDGRWVMPVDRFTRVNGELSAPDRAGTVTLSFAGGYQATMDWTLGERSGQYAIEPFVVSNAPIAEDRTGFWYETASPGYGMSVVTQGELVMTVFFLYDQNGEPRWVWADNINSEEATRLNALSFTGRCPGCSESTAASQSAGTLDVEFQTENHGQLSTAIQVQAEPNYGWEVQGATINILSNRASGREEPFSLVPFTDESTLESYLETGILNPQPYYYGFGVDFSPAPVAGVAAPEVSSTNLQEQGVDEADMVKTDGNIVYAMEASNFGETAHTLRIMKIERGTEPGFTELARSPIGDGTEVIDGLYLINNRSDGRPDLVIVSLGGSTYYDFGIWFSPYPWIDTKSRLIAIDVSEPASPQLVADIEIEGGGVETRRIGETLYHISRYQPAVATGQSTAEVQAALDSLPLSALLPEIHINGQAHALVRPESTLLPPQPPNFRYTDLITLSAFDLDQMDQPPRTVTFAGLAETIYVSQQNVFVSSSRYASSLDPAFSVLTYAGDLFTDIHQFSLGDDGPTYAGSGAVSGFVPWGGTSPSFAFSEYEGHLRVVTSSGSWLDSEHRVTVLSLPSEEQVNLKVEGFVPNVGRPRRLGKPGELLYGLRFLEDRLYAVTFKKVDPLYVVDLSDPNDPKILGELEVPGFSDYLHPLPNDLLIGFGKGAAPAEGPGDGDFAWFQGLQVSLFSVADPLNPQLIRRVDLGRRGSESSLLSDHHAFSYLPPNAETGRAARVGIPVVIHDVETPSQISPEPNAFYPWQFTGLAMFDLVGMDGQSSDLILRDIAVAHSARDNPQYDYYYDSGPKAARSIIDEENGYLYLRGSFYATPWGDGGAVVGPF